MAQGTKRPRERLPQLWHFAMEHLLLLPIGAGIALIWVNLRPESYFNATFALSFAINDVGMAFFFALMTKEVVEATAPGGVLHPARRALLPVIAALGGAILPALLYGPIVDWLDEPALRIAWPITIAIDLAVCYFIARLVFGRHPAIPFVILIGIASNAFAFLAIALFHPTEQLRPGRGVLLLVLALGLAYALRRARVRSFWPYLLLAGGTSWAAFFTGRLHPALALVPIMPFLPHAARDPGFFVDASPTAQDALSRFEVVWRHPAQIALFFFGLVNAGVPFHALEPGTWGLPAAVIVGRPLGVLLGAGVALAAGLHLPERVGWREIVVVGFVVAIGFTFGLFASAALLPPGQLRSESSMGVVLTLVGAPLAFLAARLLGAGRFGSVRGAGL